MKHKKLSTQNFKLICISLIQFCYGSNNGIAYQNGFLTEYIFYKDKVGSIPSHVLSNVKLMSCAALCLERQCRFIFHKEDAQICKLYEDPVGFWHTYKEEAGWRYFLMEAMCPIGYNYDSAFSSCIRLFNADSVYTTYDLKNGRCRSDGGILAKLNSLGKQLAAETYIQAVEAAIGLTSNYVVLQGRKLDINQPWFYDDGSHSSFANWDSAAGEPESHELFYALSISHGYKWHGIDSDLDGAMFLCEVVV